MISGRPLCSVHVAGVGSTVDAAVGEGDADCVGTVKVLVGVGDADADVVVVVGDELGATFFGVDVQAVARSPALIAIAILFTATPPL